MTDQGPLEVGCASALRAPVAARFTVCAGCGDDIWPNERIFPAVPGGDLVVVLCKVCEVKRQIAEARAGAKRGAEGDPSKDLQTAAEEK